MLAIEFFQSSPLLFALVTAIFGLMVGSFLNVVIYRLPRIEEHMLKADCNELFGCPETGEQPFTLWGPRSKCPSCGYIIAAKHNIPILSFLLLRGKCAKCNNKISIRYPIIEAFSGLVAFIVAYRFGFGWQAAAALVFSFSLISLSMIDFDYKILPDSINQPLLWCGIAIAFVPLFVGLRQAVIGAMVGYLSLWIFYQLYRLLTGKEGMGFGDFKLLAACGAWMGWLAVPAIVLMSSLLGSIIGITLIKIKGYEWGQKIPFGPYIAGAAWIQLLWGEKIIHFIGWDKLL